MKRDSRCSTGKSAHLTINQILSRQTPVQTYQCSHCVLIFASKLVLLEHLDKAHDLDAYDTLKHATSSAMDDAGPITKPRNDIPREKSASALQPEENKLSIIPDMLSKVNVNKQVAVEKSNSHIAKPTSKDKRVTNLAGRVKESQKTSRKITQYFTPSSVPNVKSPSFQVSLPDQVRAANTAKKTLISQKSNPAPNLSNDCALPFKSYRPPSELDIKLINDRTKRVLDDSVTPPPKKPKNGLIKIRLPTCKPRKSHFPDSSKFTLELSSGEEDHKLPKDERNHKEHNGNADISPTKQMEAYPSKKSPTSQAEFYKCDSCSFDHKSVVAMFVHYQIQHPKLVMTLDQIKQAGFVSDKIKLVLPPTSSENLNMDTPNQDDKPMDPSDKNPSLGSSEKTKDKSKLLPEENISSVNPKDFPDIPSQGQHNLLDDAGSPRRVHNDCNPTLILSNQKTQRGVSNSPQKVKPCNATKQSEAEKSPVICRGRITKKPPPSARLTTPKHDGPIRDNDVVKKESCAGADVPASPTDGLKDKDKGDCEAKEAKDPVSRGNRLKKLFFCPKCNYGNRFLTAILVHYRNKHKPASFKITAQAISIYTASIHRQMKKSKSPNNNINVLSSGLPIPILLGEGMFFCPLCNYSYNLVNTVMDHQRKAHPDSKKTRRQILGYTAEVYAQPREEQFKFAALQIGSSAHPSPGESETVQTSLLAKSVPVSKKMGKSQIQPFFCHKCRYTASNAYLLKRHLSKNHLIHQTAEKILRKSFDKGLIKEGYYCQWCNFSDKKAERVFEHYKEMHKTNRCSLKHILNHLHVAPKDATSKKPKDPASPVASQGSGSKESRTYSCQTCSFKGSSLKGITKHYLTVHPMSVKEKASVFDGISSGVDDKNSHALEADGHHEVPASLDYYEAPQELEPSPSPSPISTPSSKSYMCRFCSALFTTWHGLKTHYGMKHCDKWQSQPLPLVEETVMASDGMVGNVFYKCPWCEYVHTTKPGVVTHCLNRHSTKNVTAEGFESLKALVPQGSKSLTHRSRLRIGGYLCQLCKEVLRSEKKFKMHYMKRHGNSVPCVLKPAAKYALKKQLLSKYHGAQGSALKKAFSIKKQPGLMRCPFCKHMGKSKDALTKHVEICSKSMRDVLKCSSCSYITLSNKYLRKHNKLRHGIQSNAPAMEYTAVSYNCRLCPYVSSKSRYLASHYTKSHGMDAPEEFEDNKSLECRKCSQLELFSSYSGLSVHYTGFHRTHFKMDFKVLYGSPKHSAVAGYVCQQCSVEVQSTRELWSHLENHREQKRKTMSSVAVTTAIQCNAKGPSPSPKPQTSPDPNPEREPPGSEAYACKLCGRRFPSLVGLRVHERSHEAVAALQQQDPGPVAWSENHFDRFIRFRPGSLKPFHCCICAYRTNLMCLLRIHIMKKHSNDLPDQKAGPSESVEEEVSPPAAGDPPAAPPDLQKDRSLSPLPAAKTGKHSVYAEPAEVQRQLSHYKSMSPANSVAPLAAEVPYDRLLHCEFCDFSSEHWSSVRRHYMNIHGKKVLRCKDCCFFTGIRKNLNLHKETGHSNSQMEPLHKKSLRCPLCLYHTKSQNQMVDHIMLHRQERVVPIEVRRPKLSRYLHGIVFRCHKCTFTSGSAANLRNHALKHNTVRPYACRLCYFDCTRLSELEAHLCDKHQVVRNHELVGQVNLDHLGTRPEGDEDGDEEDVGSYPREGNDRCDNVQQQEKHEEQDVTAGPLRIGAQEAQEQQVDDEVGSLRSEEEEEERQRRCDVQPTVLENKCFRGVGFAGKPRGMDESEVSELEDEGSKCTPHNNGPNGRTVAEDEQTRKSLPDLEAQTSSTVSVSQPLDAPHITNSVTRTGDKELFEKPFLSLENTRDHRRKCDDELGNSEMPILEYVYLNHRNPTAAWQDAGNGSLQCGMRERQEAPEEIPSEGPVNEHPIQDDEALEGREEAETSLAKGTIADNTAGVTRPFAKDYGALSCPYCGRIFSNGPELLSHIKRHVM